MKDVKTRRQIQSGTLQLAMPALLLSLLAETVHADHSPEPEPVPLEITQNDDDRICARVDARKSWQRFNLWRRDSVELTDHHDWLVVPAEQPGWSVDTAQLAPVGVEGHQGRAAQKLRAEEAGRLHDGYPYGALMVRVDGRHVFGISSPAIHDLSTESEVGFASFVDFQINEAHTALADNSGALVICLNTTR